MFPGCLVWLLGLCFCFCFAGVVCLFGAVGFGVGFGLAIQFWALWFVLLYGDLGCFLWVSWVVLPVGVAGRFGWRFGCLWFWWLVFAVWGFAAVLVSGGSVGVGCCGDCLWFSFVVCVLICVGCID